MIYLSQIEESEAQIISLLSEHEGWQKVVEYLQRCLENVIDRLGKTENSRDDDMTLKGQKATLEHIIELPELSKKLLTKEEVTKDEEVVL